MIKLNKQYGKNKTLNIKKRKKRMSYYILNMIGQHK